MTWTKISSEKELIKAIGEVRVSQLRAVHKLPVFPCLISDHDGIMKERIILTPARLRYMLHLLGE
jgi:hypothetical protein